MDRIGIIVVSVCAALLIFWFVNESRQAAKLAELQREFARTNIVAVQTPTNNPAVAPALTSTATVPAPAFDTNAPEDLMVLKNADARYTFTSRGGGLKSVELLHYPETISARWKKGSPTNGVATLNNHVSVPVLAILGDASLVGDGVFALSKLADGVRAEKLLPDGLRLVKEFHLSSNYLVNASVRLENTTDKPLVLPAQEWVVGTATPMDVDDNGQLWGAMWFDGTNAVDEPLPLFMGGGFLSCSHSEPKSEIRSGADNVVWASAHNQFFALVAMTRTNEPAREMVARPVTLPRFQDASAPNSPAPQGIQTALVYPGQTLTANSSVERQLVFFAGPKEFRTLARIGEEFQNHADHVMNFGTGYVAFFGIGTFFAKLLLSAMNLLHDLTGLGYGWTIVLITILIKGLFWPLTAKATRSMKRMQALAPEMNALKEKYKDDVQKLTSKQWELYKKHKVNPMSGCLPMLIQMPVFIGFYTMIRSAIELRGASFLWVADLSKPDTLFMIPGLDFPFNLLPLLMGASMLWQSHLTPPSPGMDPAQQKMMRWLPAMFIVFLYNFSAGLALYWTVNNLLTILQTKLTYAKQTAPVAPVATTVAALTPTPKKKK